jgi:hypothetical protein
MSQGFEFFESVDDDHVGHDAGGGRRCASAQRRENYFLRGAGDLACVLDQFRGFRAAHPVRHFYFLKVDIQSELA